MRKPKQSNEQKTTRALQRAVLKVGGIENYEELKSSWSGLKTGNHQEDQEKGNGIIISLLNLGLSQIEIRGIIGCSSTRIDRMRDRVAAGNAFVAPIPKPAGHACSEKTIEFLYSHMNTWEPRLEQGFPCPHLRIKHYFIQENDAPKITWSTLHEEYVAAFDAQSVEDKVGSKAMKYSTFTQYVHQKKPGLRLSRTKQDACDSCIRLEFVLANPEATADEKLQAQAELDMHNDAAVTQRRAVSKFTRDYALSIGVTIVGDEEDQVVPAHVDDNLDGPAADPRELVDGEVLLLAEDYGQEIALPHYGNVRPSVDYFQSNLMLHMYVIADISRRENNVLLYDERLMGKDKDALCSLRMTFHIQQRNRCLAAGVTPPKVFIAIRDNCVGQNKSNITLKLKSFFAMSFYEKVLIIYLIPGHSHMIADRVVAWAKKALSHLNLYSPQDIVERMNAVKGMKANFIDHEVVTRPCYNGWEQLFNRHLKNLPANFTSNYVFEFSNGRLRMQHLVNTPPEDCVSFVMTANPAAAAREMKQAIFGTQDINNLDPTNLRLPKIAVKLLDGKKVTSLQKKYSTIPVNKIAYFPDPIAVDEDNDEGDAAPPPPPAAAAGIAAEAPPPTVKRKRQPVAPGARKKPGPKPRGVVAIDPGSPSIMAFYGKAIPQAEVIIDE